MRRFLLGCAPIPATPGLCGIVALGNVLAYAMLKAPNNRVVSFARTETLLHRPRVVIAAGIAMTVAILSVFGILLADGRQDAKQSAIALSHNTMLAVERDIFRNISLYYLSLQAVVNGVEHDDVMALPDTLRQMVLFDRSATAKYLGAILVLDEHGRVIIESRPLLPLRADLSGRGYFIIQRDNPHLGLYVSPPMESAVHPGEMMLTLSLRVTKPDGSFGGVVVGAISLDYFHNLLAGMDVGPHGSIALIHTSGELVMRWPYQAKLIGRNLNGTGPFTRMAASPSGLFADTASIDGIRRLYLFKHLQGYPLIVMVAPAEQDIYAEWNKRARHIGAALLFFGGAFIGLAVYLAISLSQRNAAVAALRMLARTDGLTGLNNRRTFDEMLTKECQRAARNRCPLSVLFIDVDHFKTFNDTYGHQTGDDVLSSVAGCIGSNIRRPADFAARYGGEEFVVVLPNTGTNGALTVADKLRRAVGALEIEHAATERGHITVSIGVATWEARTAQDVKMLVKTADEALYNAKASGRNAICGLVLA